VIVFNRETGKVGATLTGHSKRVNAVAFAPKHPHVLVSGGHDKTTKVWRASAGSGAESVQLSEFKLAATMKDHAGEVTAVCAHPTSQYFVTASADKTWAFYDLEAALCLTQVTDSSMAGGYTCAAFHPDGLILGTGTTENLVRIWDVKSQDNVAKFEGHTAAVTGLSFSENGYHLATCAADGVKLWDLRKVKVFKTLTPYDGAPTAAVKFDTSGLYLGVGGVDARVYGVKQDWEVVATYTDIKKAATALAWTPDAKELLVCSMDRNLRTYGTK
jgi:pre-mRNA-processing factor 19